MRDNQETRERAGEAIYICKRGERDGKEDGRGCEREERSERNERGEEGQERGGIGERSPERGFRQVRVL